MTLEDLIEEVPGLAPYFEHMPEELHNRYTIRVYRRERLFTRRIISLRNSA